MDLSLLPVLSLLMVISALVIFFERMLPGLDSEEATKDQAQDAVVRSSPSSINGGYLFLSAIILTLIGDIPNWIVWMFWGFVVLNIISILAITLEHEASNNEGQFSQRLLSIIWYCKIASVPMILVLFGYTVYAAWTMT